MENNIKKILEDIYKMDPTLKNKENEIILIIENLIKNKPNIIFDENFAIKLRQKLMQNFKTLKNNKKEPLIQFNFFKKLTFALSGAAIAILIIIPSIYLLQKKQTTSSPQQIALFTSPPSFVPVEKYAFGSLKMGNTAHPDEKGRGSGGLLTAPRTEPLKNNSSAISRLGIVNYKYIYSENPLDLQNKELEVLKRIKTSRASQNLANNIKNTNLGLLNLSSLNNPSVQHFTISENRDFGYAATIDMREETISLNKNWENWPNPAEQCRDQKCYESYKLKPNDIPEDKKIIEIANNFAATYGINLEIYDAPEIDNRWKENNNILRNNKNTKENLYIPESISVIYPIKLNEKPVYEQSGNKMGLTITIDLRHKKVSALWNLTTQNYKSSFYEAETNSDKILQLAENGGFRNYIFSNPKAETKKIELGSPEIAYIKIYNFNDGQNEELIAPALVFPIITPPEDDEYFHKKNIIVPLIKELLDEKIDTPQTFSAPPARIIK